MSHALLPSSQIGGFEDRHVAFPSESRGLLLPLSVSLLDTLNFPVAVVKSVSSKVGRKGAYKID